MRNNLVKWMKANQILLWMFLSFSLLFVAGYIFIELAEEVLENEQFMIDHQFQQWLSFEPNSTVHHLFQYITELGSIWFLMLASTIAVVVLYLVYRERYLISIFMINMAGTSLLTLLLKQVFQRDRPQIIDAVDGVGYSFPSGHATGAMAFYGFLAFIILQSQLRQSLKFFITTCLVIIIGLVLMSRVILDVHYFTDIVAGGLLSFGWLQASILSIYYLRHKSRSS
ncbi:undecaprenyl-diphosphatase [Streptohalobacillus salinus]|uniref:Undecaprenyl-diphosphatase n=1 Tax=Streptohalobacillus salinus TaxID=621096 RepID=A0A2V3W950_9BACI|nr:phosphatase PAP2 family protein [Streptohalobacillus salinus]PXW90893.1 undecaprenyl-diphosphatase [Streptohalobacillus salinus]